MDRLAGLHEGAGGASDVDAVSAWCGLRGGVELKSMFGFGFGAGADNVCGWC